MRRARILTAAVAATALAGASATGVASAAPPAWHYCAKATPKNTGNFTDKSCSTSSAPGQGKYELLEGVGKAKTFKGKDGFERDAIRVVIPGKAELHLECQKAAISGHPVAPRGVAGVRITFSKCEMLGGSCGTVTTEALSGELGWLEKAGGKAGVSLTNEASPGTGYIAQFTCELGGPGTKFRVFGAFIGEIPTSGAVGKQFMLTYRLGQYVEEPNSPTNPPAFEESSVGTMLSQVNSLESKGEWEPAEGGYRSGTGAQYAVKGEALAIF
jgi:hypothetical protein